MDMKLILKVMTAVIVTLGCFTGCQNCKKDDTRAKYIFYFIGDGMGNSHVALTESYLSYKAGKEGGITETMLKKACLCISLEVVE